MKIDEVRDTISLDSVEGIGEDMGIGNWRKLTLALLTEHEKGIQVNMSWDQPEAYDQWYEAHAAVNRILEKMCRRMR